MEKKFKARLKKLESSSGDNAAGLGWRIVDIPFDVKKVFGKGGRIPVRGTVNGFPFRTSLFPRKNGPHFLLVNKAMQKAAEVSLGDVLQVAIEFDREERKVAIPASLKKVLSEEKGLLEYYNQLTYSMQKYFADHVMGAKSPTTQRKRIEQLAEILMEMRDGEEQPPPILEAEFVRNPKAREGWEKMSPSHRRGHLWGIAYYRNPESKQRRLQKAIKEMVEYGEKRKH